MTNWGFRIREERTRLGMNQDAFAALAKQSRKSQIRYESAERPPDIEYLTAIEKAGVDVAYIITGRHKKIDGNTIEVFALVVSELQRWQIEHKKTLPPEAAARAVLALLDLVEGDASRVKLVASTVLKLVA